MNRAASVGVKVMASSNDVNNDTTMVIASARKKTPPMPSINASGTKTTTGVSVYPTNGRATSAPARFDGAQRRHAGGDMRGDVLDDDDRIVDDQADGGGDAAERH